MPTIIDAHCHPTLKRYLFDWSIYHNYTTPPRKSQNYTDILMTVKAMRDGNVYVGLAAHYLPEYKIKNDWKRIRLIRSIPGLRKLANRYIRKLEDKTKSFEQTLKMIDNFEENVKSNTTSNAAMVAHNYQELEEGLAQKKTIFIHALEGGHHLGRDLPVEQYIEHIRVLKHKGVALITLLHWYPNNITSPTEGVPPRTKKLVGMQYVPSGNDPLSTTVQGID
ncbi:membrane dipeptidase [Flavisolibacter nicotianae]|uniref:membrane dipeptidase n=1 Tax=Flavisolibacter nicotianae TaxID=2364882 RepID=UPI000EB1A32C|nr:membrane dipeptidase [Flavisolibacter nicotianae]